MKRRGGGHIRFFDPAQVLEIRASTESITILARRYGVSRGCIMNIRIGRTYKDVVPA